MPSVATPRIAVVGAGLIGRKHIDVIRQLAALDAVIDPDPLARDLAATHDALWFADLDGYLSHNRPDGVIVASPNQLHLPHGKACLHAGVPVLIEKPLADNLANAQELARLSVQTETPVLVGHHRRHSPLVKTAHAAIQSGRVGRIATVNAQFWLYKPADYFDVDWRRKEGAGPTYINLIHDIDLLRFFCGEITAIQARQSNAIRQFDVEDSAAVLLEFANGALGTVSISDTVVAPWSWELTAGENPAYPKTPMSCYMIGGTEGSLSVPDLRLWQHPGEKSWWAPIEDTRLESLPADPVQEQFRHFLGVISGRESPLVSAAEGVRNMQVLDAIKRAAQTGTTQFPDS